MKFWRQAGLTYLRYLNYSSKVVRAAVRSGVQQDSKFASRETATLTWRNWTDGKKNPAGTSHITGLCGVFYRLSRPIGRWNGALDLYTAQDFGSGRERRATNAVPK